MIIGDGTSRLERFEPQLILTRSDAPVTQVVTTRVLEGVCVDVSEGEE